MNENKLKVLFATHTHTHTHTHIYVYAAYFWTLYQADMLLKKDANYITRTD